MLYLLQDQDHPHDQVHPQQIPQPQMPPQENPNAPPPDYQQMLENLLVLPGREHLPRLSNVPIPGVETIWYKPPLCLA